MSDVTSVAEVTCVMTSTQCVWRDSAHVHGDIHRSPASAVIMCLVMIGRILKRNESEDFNYQCRGIL